MQVLTNIDEADVGRVRVGQEASVLGRRLSGPAVQGAVSQIRLSPQTVQNVVTYPVMLDVANPDLKLKPGMTANVQVPVDVRKDVLRVPNAALRFRPDNADLVADARKDKAKGAPSAGSASSAPSRRRPLRRPGGSRRLRAPRPSAAGRRRGGSRAGGPGGRPGGGGGARPGGGQRGHALRRGPGHGREAEARHGEDADHGRQPHRDPDGRPQGRRRDHRGPRDGPRRRAGRTGRAHRAAADAVRSEGARLMARPVIETREPHARLPDGRDRGARARRHHAAGPAGRVPRGHGAVRVGQVDVHEHRRLSRPADLRPLRPRGRRRLGPRPRPAREHPERQDRVRVPELQPAFADERPRERRAPAPLLEEVEDHRGGGARARR